MTRIPGLPILALVSDDPDGSRSAELEAISIERAARGRSRIATWSFPGAGHNLMRYRPREVSAAVLEVARTIGR